MQPGGYLDKYQLAVQYEERDGSKFEALLYISPELTAYVVDQLPADRVINVKIQSNTKPTVSAEGTLTGPWSETVRVKTSAATFEVHNFAVEALNSSAIRLSWDPPSEHTADILGYVVNLQVNGTDDSRFNASHHVPSGEYTHVIGGLPADSEINVKAQIISRSRMQRGETVAGNWSEVLQTKTYAVPSAPLNVTAEAINSTGIQISWRQPHNIDRKLNHYWVLIMYNGYDGEYQFEDFTVEPSRNSCVVSDLPPATDIGVMISLVVKLENQDGVTEEGTRSDEVTVTTHPATFEVHNFAVEALNSYVIRLSWDPPSEHTADILGYVVNLQVDGNNDSRSNAIHHFPSGEYTHVIGGLPADSEINVKAQIISRSRMQRGETVAGNWSEVLQTKTYAVPSAPLNVTAEAINSTGIQISWRPPNNIDRKLYHYWVLIMYKGYDGEHQFKYIKVEPSRNSCVVSDLPPATDIEVMISLVVKLENQGGVIEQGKWSDEVTVTTHPVPFEVHNFAVEALNSSAIRLSWDPPSEHTADILGYVVNLQVNGTDDSRFNASHHFPSGEYTHVIGELPADREINVKAQIISRSRMQRGENVAGEWSEVLQTKTYAVPTAPLDVTLEAINSTAIQIRWRPPPNIDRKLVYYTVIVMYYGDNGDYQYKNFGMEASRNSCVANDLPPATKVDVVIASVVRLEKKGGLFEQGGWSTQATVTTHTVPFEVHNFAVEALNSSAIRLSWDPPSEHTADILGYVVNLQVNGTDDSRFNASHHVPSGEYTHVIGELPADSEINVKAQIISRSRMQRGENVAGDWSEVLQTKTYAVPSAPLNVTAEAIDSTAIQISWRPPHNIDRKLYHYWVLIMYYEYDGGQKFEGFRVEPSRNSCVVSYLPPATDIEVMISLEVKLENQDGVIEQGTWSDEITVTTHPVPFEVHNFAVEALNSSAIRLSWDPPSEHTADILGYVVNLQVDGTNDSRFNASHHVPSGEYTHVIGKLPADSEINVKAQIISRSRMQLGDNVAGDWSEVLQTKTYAVPSAPLDVTAEAINSTAIHITWRPPPNIDRKLVYYSMFITYYGHNGDYQYKYFKMEPSTNSFIANDLPPATKLNVVLASRVRLEKKDGLIEQGGWSKKATVTTHTGAPSIRNTTSHPATTPKIRSLMPSSSLSPAIITSTSVPPGSRGTHRPTTSRSIATTTSNSIPPGTSSTLMPTSPSKTVVPPGSASVIPATNGVITGFIAPLLVAMHYM
ncbi:Protein sidekick-2 [Sparganum proliferum]